MHYYTGWVRVPVLGHLLKHMPRHVLRHVLGRHVPEHVLEHDLAAAHYRLTHAVPMT